jgi:phage antirepressor YoqD-like protein
MNEPFIVRQLSDACSTKQHVKTGYINISPIFISQKKKPSDFTKSRRFKSEVSDFAKKRQCKEKTICFVKEGGRSNEQGTWVHPKFVARLCTILPKWVTTELKIKITDAAVGWGRGDLKHLIVEEPDLFNNTDPRKDVSNAAPKKAPPPPAPVVREVPSDDILISKRAYDALAVKASAYDAIMNSGGLFSLMDVAKMIGAKNLGRTNLRKWMTENKIVYIDDGRVIAYQDVINKGWAKCFARMYTVEKHSTRKPYTVTRYTMKGVVGILNMLKEAGISPKDAKLDSNVGDLSAE